jgi:drug/metabolite transporter (DMT)-like permease
VAIALAGARVLGERVSSAQRVGMALALAGVLYVIARGEPERLLQVRFNVGDGWIVVAALSWVAYTVLLQRWPSALAPGPRLAAITAGGLIVLLPLTLAEAWVAPGPPLGARAFGLIVLAALLPGFISYQAYAYMLRELGTARSALVLYLAPVYAAGTAWLVLDEPPRAYHAVGAALILPSIWLASRKA